MLLNERASKKVTPEEFLKYLKKKCKAVVNLDGSFNLQKSLAAAGRKIQFK